MNTFVQYSLVINTVVKPVNMALILTQGKWLSVTTGGYPLLQEVKTDTGFSLKFKAIHKFSL